jgi:hypothetical protein
MEEMNKMNSMEIDKLDELYENLKRIPNLDEILIKRNGLIEYETEHGKCTAIPLKSTGKIGVLDCTIEENSLLKIHKHMQGLEILIVYDSEDGKSGMEVHFQDGSIKHVGVSELIVIEKDVPHTVSAKQKIKLIGITIPKDQGYP